jgi:hypothetical protein
MLHICNVSKYNANKMKRDYKRQYPHKKLSTMSMPVGCLGQCAHVLQSGHSCAYTAIYTSDYDVYFFQSIIELNLKIGVNDRQIHYFNQENKSL